MIRRAVAGDVGAILTLGAANHAAREIAPFDHDKARRYALFVIEHGAVFLSAGGMCGGVVMPHPTGGGLRATEMMWFARDGMGVKLLRAWLAWAREAGACEVVVTHRKARSKALEAAGFAPVKTVWRAAHV